MKIIKSIGTLAAVAGAAASLTYAAPAKADFRTEFTVIMLDGSGSMINMAKDGVDEEGNPIEATLWEEAVNRAIMHVTAQKFRMAEAPNPENPTVNDIPANNCYAIWSFADTGFAQRFPPPSTSNPVTEGRFHRCSTDTDRTPYDEIIEQLRLLKSAGPNNGLPQTPLAGALCDALTMLDLKVKAQPNVSAIRRRVVLQSDGKENNTPATSLCKGVNSNTTYDGAIVIGRDNSGFDLVKWAGGLQTTPDISWEYKVFNMAYWGKPTAPANTAIRLNETFETFFNRTIAPTTPGEDPRLPVIDIQALFEYQAATSGTGMQSAGGIPASLEAFYKGLTKQTKGIYRKVQYSGRAGGGLVGPGIPTTKHRITGDVDDSGCVSMADYYHVTQKDVFGYPDSFSQHVARCDANYDGWVDALDVEVVRRNMGRGCPR